MTETEKLLRNAADVAKRIFIDPSETAVLEIFRRLCCEQDEARMSRELEGHGVVH